LQVVSKEDRERIEYQEMIRERDRSNRESAQALARIEAEENNLLSNPDVQAGLRDIKKKQWARGCFCYNGGMYGDSLHPQKSCPDHGWSDEEEARCQAVQQRLAAEAKRQQEEQEAERKITEKNERRIRIVVWTAIVIVAAVIGGAIGGSVGLGIVLTLVAFVLAWRFLDTRL